MARPVPLVSAWRTSGESRWSDGRRWGSRPSVFPRRVRPMLQGRTGLGWTLASTLAVAVVAGASKVGEDVLSAVLGWDDVVRYFAGSGAAVELQLAVGVACQDLLAYALPLGAGGRAVAGGGRPALVAPRLAQRAVAVARVAWLERPGTAGTGAEDAAHQGWRGEAARPVA
jgi:hypothetical protein